METSHLICSANDWFLYEMQHWVEMDSLVPDQYSLSNPTWNVLMDWTEKLFCKITLTVPVFPTHSWPMVPFYTPQKTPEHKRFYSVFRGYLPGMGQFLIYAVFDVCLKDDQNLFETKSMKVITMIWEYKRRCHHAGNKWKARKKYLFYILFQFTTTRPCIFDKCYYKYQAFKVVSFFYSLP